MSLGHAAPARGRPTLTAWHPARPRRIHPRLRHHRATPPQRPTSPAPSEGHDHLRRDLGRYPIDLIPEFIPVIGPLDDIVVALALRHAGRQVPREVILAAWPGDTRLIERLLGRTKPDANSSSD
jgi:hypothetical protein